MLIGITGATGSGQSAAASSIEGFVRGVCSLDALGHRLLEKRAVRRAVSEALGVPGLEPLDGTQARRRLSRLAFADPAAMRALCSVMHPRMRRWVSARSAELRVEHGVFVLEGALIYEMGLDGCLDAVIVISCDRETCIRRAMERDSIPRATAEARLDLQAPLTEKAGKADWIVPNGPGTTLEELAERTAEALRRLTGPGKPEED